MDGLRTDVLCPLLFVTVAIIIRTIKVVSRRSSSECVEFVKRIFIFSI